jgi:hypothetical protein
MHDCSARALRGWRHARARGTVLGIGARDDRARQRSGPVQTVTFARASSWVRQRARVRTSDVADYEVLPPSLSWQ